MVHLQLKPQKTKGINGFICNFVLLRFHLQRLSSAVVLRHQRFVKYIDSKNYQVPQGKAAVELVSGASAGIQTATELNKGTTYNLEFVLRDANDSCVGDFVVRAQAGSTSMNFTMETNRTGLAQSFLMTFNADSALTNISFVSLTTSQTGFCVLWSCDRQRGTPCFIWVQTTNAELGAVFMPGFPHRCCIHY
uniref:DUF642 domain-containing protein n=1 Tax=Nelumbo nucifera TaxID=4432 RepID=A0A822Y5S8_NELNU|nr:TPA_asm: hypothetical protein HUJ06_026422 [Nelumbo nucifera]